MQVVGMLPINYNLSNPPYATQWDGRDNDNDYHYTGNLKYFDDQPLGNSKFSYDNPLLDCSNGCFGDWYDFFDWKGHEEWFADTNGNEMYDFGEEFIDEDGNNRWNCIDCAGEWGYIEYIEDESGNTIGYTIIRPEDVINTSDAIAIGLLSLNQGWDKVSKDWVPVGVDEFDQEKGLTEAEQVLSPQVDAYGNQSLTEGTAYTPQHSILAPMNYGKIWMQGIDIGINYLFPGKKLTLETNFSFYKSTDYYNELTKKNDPINAPKFKMNASIGWQSPIGDIAVKYRHVDKFEWKDGIWAGFIGPYDLFDLHYNLRINRYLELNLTGMNIFDDVHKEMIGGAKMGRQVIVRLTASI
tara:strand:- start:492 stop:1553 length:1062 start_codon:yes stop_codon:yes gene_type:complete